MAVPSYATDLSDIYTDTDNFSAVNGGRVTASETDDYIQGNNCWSHDPFSSGIEGGVYDAVTAPTITADDAVYIWTKCDVAATLATHTAGGIQILSGDSASVYDCFYVAGSDDYQYGGWKCYPVDITLTPSTSVGTPGTFDHFGVRWNVPSTGASKGYPMKIDAIRHGRNIEVTAGDSGTPATWDATAAYDATTTRQWGICQPTNTGAALQGRIYWGTASASVYSRESNRTIAIIDTEWTVTDFTQVLFAHASNDIIWDNVGLIALGTSNRGIIDVTANPTTFEWTNSVFDGIDTTTLLSNCTMDGSKWLRTNEVDAGGASMVGCQIITPTVAAASHGLLWNVASDPDGELDDMTFSKGTNAHSAIQFGANTPSSVTLRGQTYTGFNAANGNNDSTFYNNTGGALTINIVGGSGNVTYRNGAGASTTIVQNPVTLSIHVQDIGTQADISGAQVFVPITQGGHGWPYQASVTITRSGTTASVSHTAHGLSANDYVFIEGATDGLYNGCYQISNVTTNAYDYTMLGTPAADASGTITSTFAPIMGTTDVNGDISASYSYTSNQPIGGRARYTGYRTGVVSGEIDSTNGRSITINLVSD